MIWKYCMFVNGYGWQNNINKIHYLGLFKLKQVSTKCPCNCCPDSFLGVFLLVFNTPNSLPLGAPDSSCVGSGALFWSFTSHWFCDYERILMDTHETMINNCTYISGASLEWFSGYRVLLIFGLPIYWKTQLVRDLVWFNLIYLTVEIGGYQHESNLKLAVLSNA